MVNSKKRIEHLDGIRGFAILLVVFFHAYARWPSYLSFVSETKNIFIFQYGFLGVQLFFMISGFVIFMSLDKSDGILDFMRKRWIRLFPIMLISSLLVFVTASFFSERPAGIPGITDLIPGLIFIHPEIVSKILGMKIISLEGAFWSIYVEMMFYVFSCVIYFVFGRRFILKSIFIAFSISYIFVVINKLTGIDVSVSKVVNVIGFSNYGWFFIGCFIYEKINGRVNKADHLMMVIVIFCNLSFAYNDISKLVFMICILCFFCYSFYSHRIKVIFTSKFFVFFGLVSYPLYLIHENMMVASTVKLLNLNYMNPYLTPLVSIFIITLVSYLILKLEPKLKVAMIKIIYWNNFLIRVIYR
ncbi:acyltransferase [Moritella sp. 28]|uniref:acyltransferase family protein n=1 Tax=Moritella sp. 28 TaxID=2746232 RepID=UPI001BAD35AD|nr:acyltransferase [Moritella sp. 28]QUM83598.1 acyltransferase [Moritella sp. 28]